MFEINSNKTIKKVTSLPPTGEVRFLYYNTTDGIVYSWNTVTNQFEKLNNSSSVTLPVYSKVLFIDPINGSDTSGTGSDNNMFKTIAKALTVANGTGFRIVLAPGVYNESPTISLANIDIVPLAGTDRGNAFINGTVTFTHTSSSSGIQGISMTNLVHSGAGALYVTECQVNTLLNKTSASYIEITDTQLQGTSASTLSAGNGLIKDCLIKNMTISGASSGYTLKSNIIDADGTVTFTGGAFYNIQDNSGNIITTAGTNMELGLIAQGLSSALAKQFITDFSNKLGMLNPDSNATPTKFVTYNETTKRLEVSALPISGDRYKTTSTTCNNIVSTGNLTFTVETGLAYTPLQDIIVYADAANHMHGEVVSYNSATGVLVMNVHQKSGSGNYCNWTLNLDAIKLAEVSVYFDDVDPITAGQTGIEGDLFYKTNNGLNTGSKLETWVYDGTTWVKVDEKVYASASVLAANACVGTIVNIPTGNTDDVKTVGTGGDFADLQTALANTSVVDNTILRLVSNLTTSTTINVNKKVIIDGNGFNLESDTANPVNMLNITAGATVKNFAKITHLKTTNTSVETVISINSPDPVYIYNNTIELQEFGIVTRGSFFIGKNTFKYVGASLTNSHRFIMLNGNSGESRIYENNYECSVMPATTRYSNFIYATSTTGTVYEGKLFINNNIQTAGNLRQFYLHDSGVPNNMELYVANNTFNDFNGGIGIFGVAVYNGYKKIGIYSNTQGADSAGNYKGLFYLDGTGAINENVVLEYGDNILGTTALRADYLSYDVNGSSEIAIKNTVTFVNKKEKVTIQESLEDLGILIQELKGKKTYITDSNGNSLEGLGTLESPYKLPEVKLLWIELTSEGRTNGVEVPTAGGYYLVYNYKGQTIYRYITTAIDSNGYPLQDEFYSTLTGTTLSNLITKRY